MNSINVYTPLSGQIVLVDHHRKICTVILGTRDIPAELIKRVCVYAIGIKPPDYVFIPKQIFYKLVFLSAQTITGTYNRRKD